MELPKAAIEGAMLDLPSVMNSAPPANGEKKVGELLVRYSDLRAGLEKKGHERAAAEWAIHRHVEAGRLSQEPGIVPQPFSYGPNTGFEGVPEGEANDRESSYLRSTPALQKWWHESLTEAGNEEVKQAACLFGELRQYARKQLKGQERAVIEALCDSHGELPIPDLALKDGVEWDDPFQGFKDVRYRLKPKLKRKGWQLERQNNAARLVKI
jgi:hypothetical protein